MATLHLRREDSAALCRSRVEAIRFRRDAAALQANSDKLAKELPVSDLGPRLLDSNAAVRRRINQLLAWAAMVDEDHG
jgi:hypothetical protein